jgi:prepilin-type N-terminal cleavage/methylation domain-containing protein
MDAREPQAQPRDTAARRSRSRDGMTLVELLVVTGIVSGLMAMLLPAVQTAREAARRTACLNNLRNLGCGLHGHLLAHRQFPIGCLEWQYKGRPKATNRCLAWSAFILPWLEETTLTEQIDDTLPFDHPANATAGSTVIPLYICPSADRSGGRVAGLGRSDYGGVTGERITSPNDPEKGGLIHDRGISDKEITDGLSHTLLVGECSRGPWSDGQWINGRNLFDQACAINWETWEDEMRSQHPGGALALAGDGSVAFLAQDIDLRILAAACTRAGGEISSSTGAAR